MAQAPVPYVMPLFKRRQQTVEQPVGMLMCQARGCVNHTALRCGYVDRRGRTCRGTFCPQHRGAVRGVVYCRRHANTMLALGDSVHNQLMLPDVDNRGPSLVNWIAAELDHRVRALLGTVAEGDERVLFDAGVSLAYDQTRRPRWERSWKLVESTGLVLKVSINVDEREDALVSVRVGNELVAQGVPPWIARRHTGEILDPDVDRLRRELFYKFLEENISDAVVRVREQVDNPTWVA